MSKITTQRKPAVKEQKSASISKPATPEPLTLAQIDLLTENLLDGCCREDAVITPLILLMDELARHSFEQHIVDHLTGTVMRRVYAGTSHADKQEKVFIARARAQWATRLEALA